MEISEIDSGGTRVPRAFPTGYVSVAPERRVLTPGGACEHTVVLLQFGSLDVHVVDAGGQPSARLTAVLSRASKPEDSRTTTTAMDGRASFEEVEPGAWTLTIDSSSQEVQVRPGERTLVTWRRSATGADEQR